MENAFSYVLGTDSTMQGGDGRYNRFAQIQLYKDANPDLEFEVKTKRVTDKVSETLNVIANEPSLAFFRIQEHVRKCLPQLVETKHEVQELQQKIQGSSFDTEYQTNAVREMQKSSCHFDSIQDLLKNAIFMKQQIDYEKSRSNEPPDKRATSGPRNNVNNDTMIDHSRTSINADSPVQPYIDYSHVFDTSTTGQSAGSKSGNIPHSDSDVTLKKNDEDEKKNTSTETEQKTSEFQEIL